MVLIWPGNNVLKAAPVIDVVWRASHASVIYPIVLMPEAKEEKYETSFKYNNLHAGLAFTTVLFFAVFLISIFTGALHRLPF